MTILRLLVPINVVKVLLHIIKLCFGKSNCFTVMYSRVMVIVVWNCSYLPKTWFTRCFIPSPKQMSHTYINLQVNKLAWPPKFNPLKTNRYNSCVYITGKSLIGKITETLLQFNAKLRSTVDHGKNHM